MASRAPLECRLRHSLVVRFEWAAGAELGMWHRVRCLAEELPARAGSLVCSACISVAGLRLPSDLCLWPSAGPVVGTGVARAWVQEGQVSVVAERGSKGRRWGSTASGFRSSWHPSQGTCSEIQDIDGSSLCDLRPCMIRITACPGCYMQWCGGGPRTSRKCRRVVGSRRTYDPTHGISGI